MKTTLYSLLAVAAALGFAQAQTAYTTPVGYTTQTLTANTFNLVGFNVLPPTIAAGNLTAVSAGNTTLSDSGVNFTTTLTANNTYTIEIKDGPGTIDGTVQDFVAWSGSDITVPAMPGVAVGDSYIVRPTPTLQNSFPIGAGLIAGSAVPTTADKIWVPTGPNTYARYWYKTIAPIGWRTTSTGANDTGAVVGDVPLVYIDGILVEKKSAAGSLVINGEVKKTGSNVLLTQGFNLISINPPVGLTLFTAGLSGDIAGSAVPTTADIVWVPAGPGVYTKYWYKTNAPIGWRLTTTGTNDAGAVAVDVTLPASVLIQRKSTTPKVVSLDVPVSYSNL